MVRTSNSVRVIEPSRAAPPKSSSMESSLVAARERSTCTPPMPRSFDQHHRILCVGHAHSVRAATKGRYGNRTLSSADADQSFLNAFARFTESLQAKMLSPCRQQTMEPGQQ